MRDASGGEGWEKEEVRIWPPGGSGLARITGNWPAGSGNEGFHWWV